ncbi:hypothetical protein ACX8XN_04715 [Calditrichota bacterium GD2]
MVAALLTQFLIGSCFKGELENGVTIALPCQWALTIDTDLTPWIKDECWAPSTIDE